MKNINLVVLVGRLTADPELKTTASGKDLTKFSVATNYSWKNKEGEWQEGVDFHNVTAWSELAGTVARDYHKGEPVCIKGRLRVNKWKDAEENVCRSVEVVAHTVVKFDSDEGHEFVAGYIAEPAAEEVE